MVHSLRITSISISRRIIPSPSSKSRSWTWIPSLICCSIYRSSIISGRGSTRIYSIWISSLRSITRSITTISSSSIIILPSSISPNIIIWTRIIPKSSLTNSITRIISRSKGIFNTTSNYIRYDFCGLREQYICKKNLYRYFLSNEKYIHQEIECSKLVQE